MLVLPKDTGWGFKMSSLLSMRIKASHCHPITSNHLVTKTLIC